MSESVDEWGFVPLWPTKDMLTRASENISRGHGVPLTLGEVQVVYLGAVHAAPPIPPDVWEQMVERGARAIKSNDPICDKTCWRPRDCACRADARACLRAALGISDE